jgi:hypothetical protein
MSRPPASPGNSIHPLLNSEKGTGIKHALPVLNMSGDKTKAGHYERLLRVCAKEFELPKTQHGSRRADGDIEDGLMTRAEAQRLPMLLSLVQSERPSSARSHRYTATSRLFGRTLDRFLSSLDRSIG